MDASRNRVPDDAPSGVPSGRMTRGLLGLLVAALPLAAACGRSPVDVLGVDGGADGGADDGTCVGEGCVDACSEWAAAPSSAGCTFVTVQHADVNEAIPDGLVVANPSEDRPATVQLSFAAVGSRTLEPLGSPVVVGPGETFAFELTAEAVPGEASHLRAGGVFQLDSDRPVAAYQHAPASTTTGNDAMLLLPVQALGREHVAHSYPGRTSLEPFGDPSYFDVIALADGTVVEWTPRTAPTAGDGAAVPPVAPGATGSVELQRFDVLRIGASETGGTAAARDVSGTHVRATAPVVVVSGCRCAQVPAVEEYPPFAGCDPLLEQLLPLDQWGTTYVAARAPLRGNERHHWRIFAGAAGVTVSTEPPLPGTPHTFTTLGEHLELEVPNGLSFTLAGDGPLMPVQYLQSAYLPEFGLSQGTARGDPSMLQAVPTNRWLRRYVLATPVGFDLDVVQVVRRAGGAEVMLDGVAIGGYAAIDATFELADVPVPAGRHVITSAEPFGLVQVGYTESESNPTCQVNTQEDVCFSSYAYAGGLAIVPP